METVQITLAVIFAGVVILGLACSLYFNVFEKEDKNGKTSGGGFGKFILAIIIVIAAFVLLGMCSKSGGDWAPRHTQVQKPIKNNVNNIIFPSKAALYIINKGYFCIGIQRNTIASTY